MANPRIQEFKKRLILEAASELFASQGFDNVTMDEIAEKAELSKATLYAYFASKNLIFFHVIHHLLEKSHKEVQAIIDRNADSFTALEQIINHTYWSVREASGIAHPTIHHMNMDSVEPEWKAEMLALHRRRITLLADLLSRCMADGYLVAREPERLAHMLDGSIRGMCLPRLDRVLPEDDRDLELLKNVLLYGIKKKTGEETK